MATAENDLEVISGCYGMLWLYTILQNAKMLVILL